MNPRHTKSHHMTAGRLRILLALAGAKDHALSNEEFGYRFWPDAKGRGDKMGPSGPASIAARILGRTAATTGWVARATREVDGRPWPWGWKLTGDGLLALKDALSERALSFQRTLELEGLGMLGNGLVQAVGFATVRTAKQFPGLIVYTTRRVPMSVTAGYGHEYEGAPVDWVYSGKAVPAEA